MTDKSQTTGASKQVNPWTPGTAAYAMWERYRDRKPRPENEDETIAPALNEERPTDD